jgi:predicted ATPase
VPELLRLKGELLLRDGSGRSADAAEKCFHRALKVARQQHAPFWELRAAMDLVRSAEQRGWSCNPRRILARVYGRFTEGLQISDLRSAKAMLESG